MAHSLFAVAATNLYPRLPTPHPLLFACSDFGHVTNAQLVAAVPSLTQLLVQRLRWVWFARGLCRQMQLSDEDVAWYEQDYESMQEFYASGGWG